MTIISGEEPDGIKFSVTVDSETGMLTAKAVNGDLVEESSWRWAFEPRAGLDPMDVTLANAKLERHINKVRSRGR